MVQLAECSRCGGLKRPESRCCPHCDAGPPRWRRLVARLLAILGPGAILGAGLAPLPGCGSGPGGGSHYAATDAYGAPPFPSHDAGIDSGNGWQTAVDAYGALPFPEDAGDGGAGPADGGPDDGGWQTAVDAYGLPPFRDGGS